MLRTIAAASAAIYMALGLTSPAADARPPRPAPGPAAPFDAAARDAIVAEIAKAMRDDYVEPDVGARAAAAIETASGAGAYDALDTGGPYSELYRIQAAAYRTNLASPAPAPA
jgi:hypothetical protein